MIGVQLLLDEFKDFTHELLLVELESLQQNNDKLDERIDVAVVKASVALLRRLLEERIRLIS